MEHYNIPIITVIFDNRTLGMVRQWQNLIYNKRFSQTTLDRGPDFVKLAEAYGLKGFRAKDQAEFAEAFKQALLFDKKLFAEISAQKEKVKLREKDFVFKMISKSVEAKARVVQKDMTEKNERMLLNLGHTFAHALETCAGLGKISHGDAVGWGIGRALCVSCNLGLCSEEYKNQVLDLIEFFGWERNAKHKVFSCENSAEKLLDAMRRDKKNSSKKIRLILQRGLCENLIREISDEEILRCL